MRQGGYGKIPVLEKEHVRVSPRRVLASLAPPRLRGGVPRKWYLPFCCLVLVLLIRSLFRTCAGHLPVLLHRGFYHLFLQSGGDSRLRINTRR
jgi:hypothetical protein